MIYETGATHLPHRTGQPEQIKMGCKIPDIPDLGQVAVGPDPDDPADPDFKKIGIVNVLGPFSSKNDHGWKIKLFLYQFQMF